MASDGVADIDEALKRLSDAGPVRISYELHPSSRRRSRSRRERVRDQGIGWSLLILVFGVVFKALDLVFGFGRRRRPIIEPRPFGQAVGVLDVQPRRAALDFGSYAMLEKDGQVWSGRSGRSLSTLDPNRRMTLVVWLIDLLRGRTQVVDASPSPGGPPGARRLAVICDTAAAASRAGGDIALPPDIRTFAELARVPLEVWLDAKTGDLRRIGYRGHRAEIVVGFADAPPPSIAWERLPDFAHGRARV